MEGTPKTLAGAIRNGTDPIGKLRGYAFDATELEHVYRHVKDFIAQKFTSARIKAHQGPFTEADLMKLYEDCTK